MKVSFENPDKINGLLTITVEDDDYKAEVEKTLKEYRKTANVPGFRPGQVPMGMIRRRFGSAVKMDAINKVLGDELQKYIADNNIAMLGEPLASEKQQPQDLEKDGPYTFMFDIAVAPEFDIKLDANDTVDYYEITADDTLIDSQVEMFASRMGQNVEADHYEDGDVLKGDLRQLDAEGNTLEGGLTVEAASVMPKYLKSDDQKKLFDGCKPGDIITFNPSKAYEGSNYELSSLLKVDREKVAEYTGDFSYQITSVQHFEKHAVDQELFDLTFGKDAVKDEKEFREKIAEGLKAQLALDSDMKFLMDVRKYAEDKVGQLTYPDSLLKRIMKQNNKDKDQEFIDKNYEPSIKELSWSLIRSKIAVALGVKIEDEDVKSAAREMAKAQFAQYGMSNVPQEYVDNYADELLKKKEAQQQFVDRAIDAKLVEALKGVVTLNKKSVSLDEFNKMMGE
ncbi:MULTISPECIES: trigger factor [Hallella]|uniref:Trigger factor n=1 Tax=Hallella faecis TaxID=2841596 RepID=A0ABV1FR05_9BACT|nr:MULTISPECIES: trigger factor [Hallella]MBP6273339.1 trigger factor [Prevotella sp.]MBS7400872.1 trigger factor [Prevotella sp.]MBU0290019.1 trigger factor [Hallella faecis]MCI7434693.1 trigger factor [Prevotella sp.]MDR3843617.1 trigger factor [Hallella sp.]